MAKASRSYSAEIAKLASLETFDSAAFVGDDKYGQDVCDFVLGLALAFNDLKDLLLGEFLLLGEGPSDEKTPTTELGMFSGGHFHFYRLILAFLYELLYLLQKNTSVRTSPAFARILKRLTKGGREAWEKLVAAAEEQNTSDSDIRFLLLARNKVAFHYDRKVIGQGFRRAFTGDAARPPFLSRGDRISSTRFYFADAAAQSYLQELFGEEALEQYLIRQPDLLSDIGHALHAIVTTFVNSRGFAWREAAV